MRIRILAPLSLVFCMLTPTPDSMAQVTGPVSAPAELLSCSGLPCVDVKWSNGQVLHLAIDTGNPRSILDSTSAAKLGIKLEPFHAPDGRALPGMSQGVLPDISLGSSTLSQIKVAVLSLKSAVDSGQMPRVDGTLGWGAFRDRILRLNFTQHTVEITDPRTGEGTCRGGKISFVTFGKTGPPIVATTGFRVNDAPVFVQVDTMFAGTLLLFPEAVLKLGLGNEASSSRKEHFPFTDSGVDLIRSEASDESFGSVKFGSNLPLYFSTPGVHLPDGLFDGTVGIGLLEHGIATFDFKAMCFELSR